MRAIDNDDFILANQLPRLVQSDDAGDVQAACNDGGMRRRTTEVSDEARKLVLLEQHNICRGQVMRNQHQIFLGVRCRRRHITRLSR